MQIVGNWQDLTARNDPVYFQSPLLARFMSKFVLDILPAALASVIGGFLFTQYQIGRSAPPPTQQASPASAEVLALVRDEHEAIVGYLNAQMAAEKSRLAAEEAETARAVAESAQESEAREKAAAEQSAAEIKLAAMASAHHLAVATAAKVTLPRPKPASASDAAPAQITVAQAEQIPQQNAAAPPTDRLARDPDSLLAKTLDLKDQVVAATKHAVAAVGDMFASVGQRIGGGTAPNARQFSSDS
jgi:hypothetical protein